MSRAWKPGDVAIRTSIRGDETLTVVAAKCFDSIHDEAPHWHHLDGGWDPVHFKFNGRGPTYRALVVIDPEDRKQAGRLLDIYTECVHSPIRGEDEPDDWRTDRMQAALREFADPKPPKPAEPTGLGAVVEDDEARRWVRDVDDDLDRQWLCTSRGIHRHRRFYADIAAVRVLAEGVTA